MDEANIRRIDRLSWMACLVAAIALRGLVVWLHADELTVDRDAYLGIARGVAEARGFCSPGSTAPTAFRPPLYPLLLGCLMVVAVPAGIAVAFVNGLFGVTTVWATHRIGGQLRLGRLSLVAALLVAVDPLLLQYTAQPMTETTCAGLVALMLLAMVSDQWQRSCREWTVGALFGLLVLCRPTFWPLVGLMVVAWSVKRWHGSRCGFKRNPQRERGRFQVGSHDALAHAADYFTGFETVPSAVAKDDNGSLCPACQRGLPWRVIVGTLLVVAPWVVRNELVLGTPLLTTTHGGYTLLLANNPVFYGEVVDQAWGTVWSGESLARWQAELDARLARELGEEASEWERDRRQSEWGRAFIVAEPRRFVRAVWHRVRSLWSTVPQGETDAGAARIVIAAVGWFYAIILLAFVTGMHVVAARGSARRRWWLLYALVITVQAVHLVYWTNARMRAPLTPVIALFAVAAVAPRAKQTLETSRGRN